MITSAVFILSSTSPTVPGGAYVRNKNTSARLHAKNAGGGLMCEGGGGGGGVFAGHYGIIILMLQ